MEDRVGFGDAVQVFGEEVPEEFGPEEGGEGGGDLVFLEFLSVWVGNGGEGKATDRRRR